MRRIEYPAQIKELIAQLRRMPGIGPRSAERIALWMIGSRDARPAEISAAIAGVTASVRGCRYCGFFTTEEACEICVNDERRKDLFCVVEQATDIIPLERAGGFIGVYHSLGGKISPLDHVGPEDLRIEALVERARVAQPTEIILALGSDVEGEATANYIAEMLRELPVAVTRLAQGMPAGRGLESADELTLARALAGRRAVS